MPLDAFFVSLAVTVVFVGFAVVLAWADRQTRPAGAKASAAERRRPQEIGRAATGDSSRRVAGA